MKPKKDGKSIFWFLNKKVNPDVDGDNEKFYDASISKEEKLRYLYSSRSRSRDYVKELDKKIAELCDRYMTFRRYDAMLRENELPVVTEYVKRRLDSLPREISGAVDDLEAYNSHIAMIDKEIEEVENEIEKLGVQK